jgi:hypothetical protein
MNKNPRMNSFLDRVITFLFFGTFLVYTSCTLSNPRIDKEAAEAVLHFFGGHCELKEGYSTSKGKYYELILTGSEILDSSYDLTRAFASNAAYLFYSHIVPHTQTLQVVTITIPSCNESFDFNKSELQRIESMVPMVNKLGQWLRDRDYKKLVNSFDESIRKDIDSSQIKTVFDRENERFGNAQSALFQGYQEVEFNDRPIGFKIFALIRRGKINTTAAITTEHTGKYLLSISTFNDN